MAKFSLTRKSTTGMEHFWLFDTKRAAFTQMGYSIVDNGHGTRAEAQRFAATVVLGQPATFGPYTFTVEQLKAGK